MGPAQNNLIAEIVNRTTKQVNTDITAGGVLELHGKGLKVVGSEEYAAYVYLINADTDTIAASVPADDLLTNTPTQVMFQVPAKLEAGKKYRVKIITQASSDRSKLLKQPRMILSDITLTCV